MNAKNAQCVKNIFQTKAVFIIFPKLETRFNTHYQNAYMHTPSKMPFLSCVYHQTLSRVRVERKTLSLRSCIAQFYPWSRDHVGRAPLCRSVGDIMPFETTLRLSSVQKHVSGSNALQIALFSASLKGFSNPLIKTALRLSFAKITLKVVWKP